MHVKGQTVRVSSRKAADILRIRNVAPCVITVYCAWNKSGCANNLGIMQLSLPSFTLCYLGNDPL